MLVHRNSHFNIANMENEVYSERSMSMHSLCSIFFFRWLLRSAHIFSCSVILQQAFIQIGSSQNFVDKAHPFDQFFVNFVIARETLPIEKTQKIKRIQPIWCLFRIRRDCNADGDCVRLLDKVKACDVALIKQMKLFEQSELFICLIVFSHITGLLLCLMTCNRNRKHYNPAWSEYVRYSTISDWFSDVLPRRCLSHKHEFYSASTSHIS